jgi:hypothetical protein
MRAVTTSQPDSKNKYDRRGETLHALIIIDSI